MCSKLEYELSVEGKVSRTTAKKYLAGGDVRPTIAARLREVLPRVRDRIALDPQPNTAPRKAPPTAA